MSTTRKRLFIKTYGCQMNVYDSDRMKDVLTPLVYESSDTPEGADLVILNTCHIREKAAEKVYSELGRLRPLKDEKAASGGMTIAVAGCVGNAAQLSDVEVMLEAAGFSDVRVTPRPESRDVIAGWLPGTSAEICTKGIST